MPPISSDQPLVPSVLDRLIDERPEAETETPRTQNQVLSEMRVAIRRDLENLLNTRWRIQSVPEEYPELKHSLVNYGTPDIGGLDLGSDEVRQEFLKQIQDAIDYFEPRFLSVKVEPVESEFHYERSLRFRIEGTVQAYPAPEQIVFDSEVEPSAGQFSVKRIL